MAVDRDRVAALVHELLAAIGEDPDRAGLRETPTRVADSYAEFFAGVGVDPVVALRRSVISVADGPAPQTTSTGIVLLRGIRFRSICEHHLLPFAGEATIGYLPGTQVVGLGALPRLVEALGARPQVQERLGEQIADALQAALDCRGVFVLLDATHECVTMRGERQPRATTATIAARGALAEPAARAEIIALAARGEGSGS